MIKFNINIKERSESRIYSRFKDTTTEELALIMTNQAAEAIIICNDIANQYNIDSSEGVQLDIIGDIVGIKRPKDQQSIADFEDESIYFKWDTPGQGWDDGVWIPIEEGEALDDIRYRILLKAKIFANYAKSTLEDIAMFVELVLSKDSLVWDGVGYVDIHVGGVLSSYEENIVLNNSPIAAGVRIRNLTSSTNNDALVWDIGSWDQATWATINQLDN